MLFGTVPEPASLTVKVRTCCQDAGLSVMSEMSAEMANAPKIEQVEEPAQPALLV